MMIPKLWQIDPTRCIWVSGIPFQEVAVRVARRRELSKEWISGMNQPAIDIYTKFACPFCVRAKRLLDAKGAQYSEHDITMGGPKREEMLARAPNAMTVPQIFIGTTHVGGSDDLAALEDAGKLDALIAG